MNIKEWLNTLPGAPSVSQAADHAEVSKATFLRHEKKGETTAEYAIKIARAYKVNEVQALLDLGFIEEAAVLEIAVDNALGFAKNSQLWSEISKRADPEARRLFRAEGKPGVVDLDDEVLDSNGAQLFDLHSHNVPRMSDDDLDAAIAEANAHPKAAHPATDELTEPEFP